MRTEPREASSLLSENTTKLHLTAYLFLVFTGICFFVFINSAQSFVLIHILEIPQNTLGNTSGTLVFFDELVSIVFLGFWGILSDKTPRRLVYCSGFLLCTIALALFPWATSFAVLMTYRLLFAVGGASLGSMMTAVASDYSGENGGGRVSGLAGISSGLGAVFAVFVLLRIPVWISSDYAVSPLRITFGVAAGIGAVAMFVSFVFLRKGIASEEKATETFLRLAADGCLAARDPKIALAYLGGFLARVDAIVPTVFLPLWVTKYYISIGKCTVENECHDAYVRSSVLTGTFSTCALLGAPVFSVLIDRYGADVAMMLPAVFGVISFSGLVFIGNPDSVAIIAFVCFGGLAQIGMIVCSMALIAKNAPESIRGSIAGVYSMIGGVGILISTKIGGVLFDTVNEGASFVIPFAMHTLISFVDLYVLKSD